MPVEATIVALRREKPTWGARKLDTRINLSAFAGM
jgi:hypothetical protein